ncbi:hypothetical protein B0G81_8140 [Paraburkholderia sp. BL6665CI2N2]|nr:hypothetical protein B0G81_8140 [Paraburkholderia sp. BL6665CI2N2]
MLRSCLHAYPNFCLHLHRLPTPHRSGDDFWIEFNCGPPELQRGRGYSHSDTPEHVEIHYRFSFGSLFNSKLKQPPGLI